MRRPHAHGLFVPRGHPDGSLRAFRRRLCVALCLLTGWVLLALMAAGPTDPLWIGGVYDGGDADDLLALSADIGLTHPQPVVPAAGPVTALLRVAETAGVTAPFTPAVPPRSPPVS
jgi:hypothetical protein